MALFDVDLYNGLLQGVLGVNPTGDPVADAVYLVLLPMIVIYMYADFVVTKSRFMGHSGKLKIIMMFIIGFTIIYYKYYGLFAAFSLPLLGIVMAYHTFSFIFGRKGGDKVGYQQGSGGDAIEKDVSVIKHLLNAPDHIKSMPNRLRLAVTPDIARKKDRLSKLETSYAKCEADLAFAQNSTDRSAGDRMREISEIEKGIINEAKGMRGKIDDADMLEIAPTISAKIGI